MALTLFRLNTQVLQLNGLKDALSGSFQNSAAVTVTLNDPKGNPVPNLTGLVLAYQGGTNGNYQATVPSTFNPPLGGNYVLLVDAVVGLNAMHLEIPSEIASRQG